MRQTAQQLYRMRAKSSSTVVYQMGEARVNLKADELALPDPAMNDTVSAILDAGAACLARYGNEKTSIQDIADTAGMSRATVYRYFPDRASLLQAVTRHDQIKQADEIRQRITSEATFEEAVAVIAEVFAGAALRYHTREHLRNHDRGLAQYLSLSSPDRQGVIASVLRPHVVKAHKGGELAEGISVDGAIEWIAVILTTIPTLPASAQLDINNPAALGRTMAARICRGIAS